MTNACGHVLVVDDHRTNRLKLSLGLKQQGHTVDEAENGLLALEKLRSRVFDLVLLDILMPKMDGYQVLEQMKGDERLRDIPVIVISAQDDLGSVVKGIELGADDYLPKNFDPVLLRARIGASLEKKRLRDKERRLQRQLQETNQKMSRELALAGEVQASFLPRELPAVPGWQMSVKLKPARETSGDFYDVNPLPDGKLGILMADVVDKGVGAALYMALSWTLLRTFAREYQDDPALVLEAANRRILTDTKTNRFATVFYGILDPATGRLLYCNAGHCQPYLVGTRNGKGVRELAVTGIPLGLFAEPTWAQQVVQIDRGDLLILYTDGITEARDERGSFFEEERLLEVVKAYAIAPGVRGTWAKELQDAILGAVDEFVGSAPQSDDMALMVVVREM